MKDLNTRIGKRLLALVLAFAMVIGMIPGTAVAAKHNAVNFEVKDSSGKAVSGAKVTVTFVVENGENQTQTEYTGGNGKTDCTYDGYSDNVTSVSYEVEKEDYITVKKTTSLGSNETITLLKSEVIMTVVDAENKPITSAAASYKVNGEGETKTAAANDAGVIVIDLADTDTKVVGSIDAPGYASIVGEIENGGTGTFTMPKAKVVFNVKAGEVAAVGAAVKVTVGENEISAVTGDDGSAVVDLSAYAVTTDTKINYTIDKDGSNADKDGYKTISGTAAVGATVEAKLEKATHLVEAIVVDADGNPLENVVVSCSIDGMESVKLTTDANGKASAVIEVENPEKLSYSATVCEDLYTYTIDCGEDKTEAKVQATQVLTLNVAISGSGSGTVTIGGNQVSNGSSLLIKKDTPIAITVAAGEKCRVKELSIPGTNNGDGTYTFAAGGTIAVEFVQTHTVTVTYNADQGTAEILDGETAAGSVTVDHGREGLKLHVAADESKGYEIASITGFSNVEGQTNVSLDIPAVKEDKNIEVTFQLKTYGISVNANYPKAGSVAFMVGENGEYKENPEDIRVPHDDSLTLRFKVEDRSKYFLSSVTVTVNGTQTTYTNFVNTPNGEELMIPNVTGDLEITVTYGGSGIANVADVSYSAFYKDENGAEVPADALNEIPLGEGTVKVFKPDVRVMLKATESNVFRLMNENSFVAGGAEQYTTAVDEKTNRVTLTSAPTYNTPIYLVGPKYADDINDPVYGTIIGTAMLQYEMPRKNGRGWKDVEVEVTKYEYTLTHTGKLTGDEYSAKILTNDPAEKWCLRHCGDMVLGDGYWLEFYNKLDGTNALKTGFGIVFDDEAPKISFDNDRKPDHGDYYKSDVTIEVTATEEQYYSGVASIEYYISTTVSTVDSVPEDAVWNIATMPVGGEKVGTASFVVDAEQYNAENVYVFVRAKDMAGNSNTELIETLHINSTPPELKVAISCAGNHDMYCNCIERKMTVTVVDRADTANRDDDALEIFWGANEDHDENVKLNWSEEKDEAGNLTGNLIGTAEWFFTEEAHYTYWAVSYLGKSDRADKMGYDEFYIDRTAVSNVVITPGDHENGDKPVNGLYGSEAPIVVSVSAEEPEMKTGIKEVKYQVGYYEGETFNAPEPGNVNGSLDDEGNFSGTFTIDPAINNRCEVVLRVTTLDNAGNEYQQEEKIDIDITAPKVEISFNNNDVENESYFDATRTATIVVTDRAGHFDPSKEFVAEGIKTVDMTITAKNAEGGEIEVPVIGVWDWNKNASHGTEIQYTTTVEFLADANYTFDFAVTDLAGNKSEEIIYAEGTEAASVFTVDTQDPTANLFADAVIVTVDENGKENKITIPYGDGWDKIVTPLTFGIWSNDTITVTGIADDVTSDIAAVKFYKHNGDMELTYDAENKVLKAGEKVITDWTDASGLKVLEDLRENENDPITYHKGYDVGVYTGNEQFTIYLQITDMAGNVSYISTNGMIVDNKEPAGVQPGVDEQTVGEIKIDIPTGNKNGFHTGSVAIGVNVVDPMFSGDAADGANGSFAGLKSVSYLLVANDTRKTSQGVLFSVADKKTDGAVLDAGTQLYSSWNGTVVVDAEDFNSNEVVLMIVAVDNAGNIQRTSTNAGEIKIDTTAPAIHIKYDNNSPDSGSFYKADRSATITVTERNFDPAAVTAYITKNNEAFAMLDPENWAFKKGADGGNGDDNTYTQTIHFNTDGDYTFHLECTDLADWTCGNVEGKTYDKAVSFPDGTQNPTAFTIDKTLPTISVSYNNNAVQNGKYFNATRTATVTIVEHNYDQNRVRITINTARGAQEPRISWRHNGDTHVATVAYAVDGDYTFDINMTDKAGNANSGVSYGNSAAAKDFVVDTTYVDMVTISGVENGAAYGYNQTVIPVVTVSDINLDTYEVTLIGVQKDKVVDLSSEAMKLIKGSGTNFSGSLDLFKMVQELDGIYTLTVTGKDMAGNVDTEEVVFTVNRFGSVYVYGEYLLDLISDGGSYVYSVDQDLVISEYNADKLLAGSLMIEVTRDGKPLEDLIYEISPEINENAKPGTSGWYQYTYTISAENFTADGVYKISVSSKDATGNTPENTNYEDMGITFRVDSTPAEITSIVGLEESIINASEIDVKYTIFDTIGLKSVKIYVDGELVDEITDFTGDMNNFTGSIHLTESRAAQSIRLVVEDMSGNITDTAAEDFSSAYAFNESVTVSTNFFVRWYANRILFWGSIVGGVGLAALLWFILVGKRKKDEESAQ